MRSRASWTTTVKPRARVQNSSSTEMSKEMPASASQTPGVVPSTSSIPRKKLMTLRCST